MAWAAGPTAAFNVPFDDGADHGQVLVAVGTGAILDASPCARGWLRDYFPDASPGADHLPAMLAAWVLARSNDPAGSPSVLSVNLPERRLSVRCLVESGGGRALLILHEVMTNQPRRDLARFGLTPRESDVLQWLERGKTNGEIAIILGLKLNTIKTHLESIYRKLGVENRLAATIMSLESAGQAQA